MEKSPLPSLSELFPSMEPIQSPPTMFTFNGIGTMIYGRRDYHPATQSYVATLCFTILFIPVLALKAYRVIPGAYPTYYFLGKEPLSMFAKAYNGAVALSVVALLCFWGYSGYASSPGVIAQKKLRQAHQHEAAGELLQAARLYHEVAEGSTQHTDQARAWLRMLFDNLSRETPRRAAIDSLRFAATHVDSHNWPLPTEHAYQSLVRYSKSIADSNPAAAREVLAMGSGFIPDDQVTAHQDWDLELLQQVVKHSPDNMEALSELAAVYEAREDLDAARKLLEPHRDQLADTEGARILGQMLVADGEYDSAFELLEPYCTSRLRQLKQAQEHYDARLQELWKAEVARLEAGGGSYEFYEALEAGSEEENSELIREHIHRATADDPSLKQAEAGILAVGQVIPVALDLGVVQLQRSQSMSDPAEREAALKHAEATFLEIAGYAQESDEFRLSLGQVYYWLGKSEEGEQLLEETLTAHDRDPQWLSLVANIKKQLGDASSARSLLEEAYEKSPDEQEKLSIANSRAYIPLDLEDKVLWLERADQQQSDIQAELLSGKGSLAERDGQRQLAETYFRQSIARYESLPVTSSVLNNAGHIYLQLFSVTGENADYEKALEYLERALALQPDSAVVLSNTTRMMWGAALIGFLGDRWPSHSFDTAMYGYDLDLLSMFHNSQSEYETLRQELRQHQGMQKVVRNLERLTVLSPREDQSYRALIEYYTFVGDVEGLQRVIDKVKVTAPDTASDQSDMRDYLSGVDDAERAPQLATYVEAIRMSYDRSPPLEEDPVTKSVRAARLAEALANGADFTEPSADEVASLAQTAHEHHPSRGTRDALITALLLRCSKSIRAQQPESSPPRSHRRAFGDHGVIDMLLTKEGPAKEAILADPNFQQAVKLMVQTVEDYPRDVSLSRWALLRHVDPEVAERMKPVLLEDPLYIATREARRAVNPQSLTVIVNDYRLALLEDQPEDAQRIIDQIEEWSQPVAEELPTDDPAQAIAP